MGVASSTPSDDLAAATGGPDDDAAREARMQQPQRRTQREHARQECMQAHSHAENHALSPSHINSNGASNDTPIGAASSAASAAFVPNPRATPVAAPCTDVSPLEFDSSDRSMAGAESALLTLQSKTLMALKSSLQSRPLVCAQMAGYLRRLGLQLDPLRIIHIAGTKGKGSTSAFVESILRAHGLTTGEHSCEGRRHAVRMHW